MFITDRFKPFVAFFLCAYEDDGGKMLKPRALLGTMPMLHLVGYVDDYARQQLYRCFAPFLIPATA